MAAPALPQIDRNLILTGYTGPNQPAIGRQVAAQLRLRFLDFEAEIEARSGYSSDALREQFGERRLRTVEAEIMEEIILRRHTLVRINGHVLLHGDHYQRLRQTGPVICLVARLDAVLSRLHVMLGARYHDPQERALAIGQIKREWAVRRLEGIVELDMTYLTAEQAVERVVALWQAYALRSV